MRLRFAVSGHAANADTKPNDEVTQSKDETTEPSDATNNETKIEAATGS
jgi:two-component system nitrogen regulation sensor histidine kinase NtrY